MTRGEPSSSTSARTSCHIPGTSAPPRGRKGKLWLRFQVLVQYTGKHQLLNKEVHREILVFAIPDIETLKSNLYVGLALFAKGYHFRDHVNKTLLYDVKIKGWGYTKQFV